VTGFDDGGGGGVADFAAVVLLPLVDALGDVDVEVVVVEEGAARLASTGRTNTKNDTTLSAAKTSTAAPIAMSGDRFGAA
jgi:hypothetical protein